MPNRFNSPGRIREVMATGFSTNIGRFFPQGIWQFKRSNRAKFVHRVDGVAELTRGGNGGRADREQFAINPLCDHTIFQSEFCEDSFKQFGVRPDTSSIVINGVDTARFFPGRRPTDRAPIRIASSSWSSNTRKGFATLAKLSEVPGVELHFFGRWAESIDRRNVIDHGVATPDELAEAYRTMDAFAHVTLNEPCSNSLLEGLASGLPAIYMDSGSNAEVVGEHGIALGEDFAQTVEQLKDNYAELRADLVANVATFSIGRAADDYMKVFEQLIGT